AEKPNHSPTVNNAPGTASFNVTLQSGTATYKNSTTKNVSNANSKNRSGAQTSINVALMGKYWAANSKMVRPMTVKNNEPNTSTAKKTPNTKIRINLERIDRSLQT